MIPFAAWLVALVLALRGWQRRPVHVALVVLIALMLLVQGFELLAVANVR